MADLKEQRELVEGLYKEGKRLKVALRKFKSTHDLNALDVGSDGWNEYVALCAALKSASSQADVEMRGLISMEVDAKYGRPDWYNND